MANPPRSVISNREAIDALHRQTESDNRPTWIDRDGLAKYQTAMTRNHSAMRRSRHVVSSPWRKEDSV